MNSRSIVLALVLSVLAGGAMAADEDKPVGPLLDGVGLDDIRAIVASNGGTVKQVEDIKDGLEVDAVFPGDLPTWFELAECEGKGDARRCQAFTFGTAFQVDNAKRAAVLEKKLAFNWIQAHAEGDTLTFAHADFTYGGVTRKHLDATVGIFLTLMDKAQDIIWPSDKNRKPEK